MKTKMEENMDEILNLDEEIPSFTAGMEMTRIEKQEEQEAKDMMLATDIDDDYTYVRANIRNIIDNSNDILDTLIPLAQASENARLYEVLAQHLKTIVESNKELIELQKSLKSIKEDNTNFAKSQHGMISVDKAVFIGNSSDVIQHLKDETNGVSQKSDILEQS